MRDLDRLRQGCNHVTVQIDGPVKIWDSHDILLEVVGMPRDGERTFSSRHHVLASARDPRGVALSGGYEMIVAGRSRRRPGFVAFVAPAVFFAPRDHRSDAADFNLPTSHGALAGNCPSPRIRSVRSHPHGPDQKSIHAPGTSHQSAACIEQLISKNHTGSFPAFTIASCRRVCRVFAAMPAIDANACQRACPCSGGASRWWHSR